MAAKKTPSQKGAETRAHNGKVAQGNAARESFTQANPQRFRRVQDHVAEAIGNDKELHERVSRAGFNPDTEIPRLQGVARRSTTRTSYAAMGWDHEPDTEKNPHPLQGTMFPHPGTVANPERWEHRSEADNAKTLKRLAEHGITHESARAAHGSRIDAGSMQEDGQHGSFYSTMGESSSGAKMPKQLLVDSAKENNVPLHVQAAANAITSPQNRAVGRKADGGVDYPNNDAANHAIKWSQMGGDGESYVKHPDHYVPDSDKVPDPKRPGKLMKTPEETRKYPVRGYPANQSTAINATSAMAKGKSVAEAWSGSNNPKTGPFHNAWVAPDHPEGHFTVLDTHDTESMAPHATQHEAKILSIPGVHAFNDHAKRMAMDERGLGSVSRTQSMTWRSTKVDEGHEADVAELTTKRPNVGKQFQEIPGQKRLF